MIISILSSESTSVWLFRGILRTDGLDDHGIDLLGRELELISGQGVRKTQCHLVELSLRQASGEEVGELGSNATHKFSDGGIGNALNVELLGDG